MITIERKLDLRRYVDEGVAFLDTKRENWRERINPSILDMASKTCCIFGQLYGDYMSGEYALDLYGTAALSYGFDLHYDLEDSEIQEQFAYLTKLWREQL